MVLVWVFPVASYDKTFPQNGTINQLNVVVEDLVYPTRYRVHFLGSLVADLDPTTRAHILRLLDHS